METTRVDRWLWAVRLCKTRSLATDACNGGHVTVNGVSAKPSTKVKVGDTVEAHLDRRDRTVEVVRIIEKRVGAAIAAECLIDNSPPPPSKDDFLASVFVRDAGAGRPTKRDRRELDRFRQS